MFTDTKKIFSLNKKIFLSLLFLFVITTLVFTPFKNSFVHAVFANPPGVVGATPINYSSSGTSSEDTGWWASITNSIKQLPKTLPLAIIGTVVYIIAMATYWIAYAAILVLQLILSPTFISYSYTNPARNPVIETGLAITQSFVNMMLVVVLVYIALATILRLSGYETKKVLIWFVIMALLVNFSPVICGVIVDASNISMNYFLSGDSNSSSSSSSSSTAQGSGLGLNMIAQAKGSLDLGSLWDAVGGGEDERDPLVTKVALYVAIAVMLIMTTIIYLMYAAVFLMRYFAIWILVILSPIAFVSYVLPRTKSMIWDKWWAQFVQWSLIGVTCGFFLFLAGQFGGTFIKPGNSNSQVGQPTSSLPSQDSGLNQIWNNNLYQANLLYSNQLAQSDTSDSHQAQSTTIIPNTNESAAAAREARLSGAKGMADSIVVLFVPAIFLAMGLFFGFQTSAMGAGAILSFTKRNATRAALLPTRAAQKMGGVAAVGIGRRLNAAMTTGGFSTRDMAHGITSAMENTKVLRWFVPESVRKHGQYRPAVESAQKQLNSYSSSDLARRVAMGDLIGERATGALTEIIGRGDSEDIFKAFGTKFGYTGADADQKLLADSRFKDALSTPLKIASNSGMLGSTLLRKDPRMARVLADQKWHGKFMSSNYLEQAKGDKKEALKLAEEAAVKTMVADVKPGNIESWEKEVLKDTSVVEHLMGREKNIWDSMSKVKGGQATAQETVNKSYTSWLSKEKNIKTKESFNNTSAKDRVVLLKQYDEHVAAKNDGKRGFFQYLESPKAKESGWTQPTWHEEGGAKTPTPVASAVNLPPVQPTQQPQQNPPTRPQAATPPPAQPAQRAQRDTGAATKRVRSTPDVGSPNPSEARRKENPVNKKDNPTGKA